jgi:hypothetical protein
MGPVRTHLRVARGGTDNVFLPPLDAGGEKRWGFNILTRYSIRERRVQHSFASQTKAKCNVVHVFSPFFLKIIFHLKTNSSSWFFVSLLHLRA